MQMKVYSIAPSVPGLNKIIAETLAEFALKRKTEMVMEEKKRKEHIPNYIDVSELLELVACGIFLDQRSTKENKTIRIQEEATKLMDCFNVEKEWPLEMTGHIGQKNSGNRPLKQVDCSEWMVYSQEREGTWSLKAFESADMARNSVEKGIVNGSIDSIIVLHDLLPISYAIMVKNKYGLSLVDKKDAHKHKQVQVVWGNTSISKTDVEVSSF